MSEICTKHSTSIQGVTLLLAAGLRTMFLIVPNLTPAADSQRTLVPVAKFIFCSVLLLYKHYSRNAITGLPLFLWYFCHKKAPKKGLDFVVFLQQFEFYQTGPVAPLTGGIAEAVMFAVHVMTLPGGINQYVWPVISRFGFCACPPMVMLLQGFV